MTFPTTQDLTSTSPKELKKTQDKKSSIQEKMPRLKLYLLALISFHIHFIISYGVSVSGLNSLENTEIDAIVKRVCTKKIGDCFEEPEMESEIVRRVLVMQKKYISYETLKRDMVPCAKPGASYYDCHAGQVNPYSRGCEVITRCRGH